FSRQKRGGCSNKSPIFILGMPRSGTTLVEQILASHPQVFGAGELTDFSIVARQFSWEELKKGSDEIVSGKADPFKKAGQDYINRVQKHADGEKFITDKMPHNFVSIGFIRLFLPNAKVIHCTRDPMDTCFSIFKHLFSGQKTHKYAYNMKELGHYYNLYLDLMEHWKITLPGYIYEIKYENLVSNQKEETRKLLEFGGLPWEEACLSFHKTKRRVATASAIQVRQPIYKDSIQLWKRYEVQLEDLQKVIGL
ncbi:MAG: sulfotransferase, partial [Desulfobacteraceae bacterium]|nr:sulfotransferase [Desulfobacteraceae bacterium]